MQGEFFNKETRRHPVIRNTMHNRTFLTMAAMAIIIALNTLLVVEMFKRPDDIFSDQPIATADFTFTTIIPDLSPNL